MPRTTPLALLLAPSLLITGSAAHADSAAPPPAGAAAQDAQSAGAQAAQASQDDIAAIRAELDRVRREAEESRRQQEERIRALEQKLQDLQKPATPTAPAAPAPSPVTTRPGFKARLYGFARADMDLDSRQMFSHPHLPFWALSSADPRTSGKDGDFTIHPRLTRLGLDTEAPPMKGLNDAKLTGKIEIDFFNFAPGTAAATSNSRQFLRIRHAYGQLDGGSWQFLFGQTWDLISPLYPSVNYDVLMWNAGNLGDRRPQLRATFSPKVGKGRAGLAVAALSSSAIDGANRDNDLTLDGEESRRPMVQARAFVNQPSWVKGQTWELGISGHNAAYRWNAENAIAGRRSFEANSIGLDLRMPLLKKLLFQGEVWTGRALADVRGAVGQDINPVTGQLVHATGGWAEALYQFNPTYTLGLGFTIDNPQDSAVLGFGTGSTQTTDPTRVGRTLNRTVYVANHFNLGSGFLLGADWMLFRTDYKGLPSGSSNRWNLWLQHSF